MRKKSAQTSHAYVEYNLRNIKTQIRRKGLHGIKLHNSLHPHTSMRDQNNDHEVKPRREYGTAPWSHEAGRI